MYVVYNSIKINVRKLTPTKKKLKMNKGRMKQKIKLHDAVHMGWVGMKACFNCMFICYVKNKMYFTFSKHKNVKVTFLVDTFELSV